MINEVATGPTESASARSRRVADATTASACYFRSGPEPGHRKALLKITDRCDLRCSHCFVSATADGEDMSASALRGAISRLLGARVTNVTITGGEPLVHPELPEILSDLVAADLNVTVCTNGVNVTDELIRCASELGRVSFNVSLDGARESSHGRFRGSLGSFERTVANSRRLSEAQLLKGILSTPNSLAEPDEYAEILALANDLDATYVLLNPLSSFGRGIRNHRLAVDEQRMRGIQARLELASGQDSPERVFIRFPNASQPLTACIAGDLSIRLRERRRHRLPVPCVRDREPGREASEGRVHCRQPLQRCGHRGPHRGLRLPQPIPRWEQQHMRELLAGRTMREGMPGRGDRQRRSHRRPRRRSMPCRPSLGISGGDPCS